MRDGPVSTKGGVSASRRQASCHSASGGAAAPSAEQSRLISGGSRGADFL
jgi:hypothetical protein